MFTYQGQPVNRCNNHAWRKALKRAGIGDFRWHDLRHTWASWHIQAGTPLHVLRELGDWSGMDMVTRYAHLGGQHLQAYAAAIETPQGTLTERSEVSGERVNLTQFWHKWQKLDLVPSKCLILELAIGIEPTTD